MKPSQHLLIWSLLCGTSAHAQLVVDTSMTPTELVQDILVGPDITVTNIEFNGLSGDLPNEQIGSFSNGGSALGWSTGLIIATGSVFVAEGPNDVSSATLGGGNFGDSDADLEVLSGYAMNDRAMLEMDFIPSTDNIQLLFAFGSEEYPEYVCSTVNDVFAILVSGPGISGPFMNSAINIAVVPGTTVPISINSVNSGTVGANGMESNCTAADPNWQTNSIYYLENADTSAMQFDGQTVALSAIAGLQAGSTYHLKIAIADAGDTSFDSAVFLAANGFTSDINTGAQTMEGGRTTPHVAFQHDQLVVDHFPAAVNALTILDGMGRLISDRAVARIQERLSIPLQGIEAGLYVLHLSGANGYHDVLKFVVDEPR